ncbi:uncharacterized protein [Primulina eburnea]|uniref:uncharacterized protein n=1 Tax=Primulina eburnea TaxID=1245227 RepID=UPI003C6BE2F7
MTHAEVSGRMVKWTIELGEYDIEYKSRVAIKAQALTDFLIEMIQHGKEEVWRIFVDGASNLSGCGVGVVLIAPSGENIKLALKIDSRVTTNEAEYEAVLAGLQAVREVGASQVIIYSDSQLVTQQIKGKYEAKNKKMLKYLGLITARAGPFTDWSIEQIHREENEEADILAKLAASMSDISTREVLCFTLLVLSVDKEVPLIQRSSWMTLIIEYIVHDKLPEDKAQAWKIKKTSTQGPLLKCLSEIEAEYVLREIHEGCYGEHLGGSVLSRKAILIGFWWPQMNQDAARLVQKYNGMKFQGKQITSWCQEMKIIQSFTSVAYPQANGQTEVTNRIIVQALKARLHGKEVVLPVEIGQSSTRIESYPSNNDQSRSIELDLVKERRDQAVIRMEAYCRRVMKSYNKHVRSRDFQVGDLVMKKVKLVGDVGKLEARWEGPFKVIQRGLCPVYEYVSVRLDKIREVTKEFNSIRNT